MGSPCYSFVFLKEIQEYFQKQLSKPGGTKGERKYVLPKSEKNA